MSIIRKGYAETSEGQVHYHEVHCVAGATLVLLHQTASSVMMFEAMMDFLKNARHLIPAIRYALLKQGLPFGKRVYHQDNSCH